MTLLDDLAAPESNVTPADHGQWWPVQFSFDDGADQVFNIGVAVRLDNGRTATRFIHDTARLHCALGDRGVRHVPFAARLAASDVKSGRQPSLANVRYGEPRHMTTHDIDDTANRLFEAMVPLARPQREASEARGPSTSTRKLRSQVFDYLRVKAREGADRIIAQNPALRVSEGNTKRYLDVPLQGGGRYGSVVSVTQRTPHTVARNILMAQASVLTAAAIHSGHHTGVFLLRPAEGSMPDDQLEKVDLEIDRYTWMLGEQNVHCVAELSAQEIGDAVIAWAELG